jgi:hypothetical protein
MKNYEYIIASLPALSQDWKFPQDRNFQSYIEEIKSLADASDKKAIDALLGGYVDENLNEEFYKKMLGSKDKFLKEYFAFDLQVRNGKARFLNKAFGRKEDQDTIKLDTGIEFTEAPKLEAALAQTDLLGREKALDDLMWNKISEITTFDYFDIDAVLAFIAKLHIIDRWLSLDEKTGREMFKKLVSEVRGTFKGVDYDPRKIEDK